MSKGPEVGMSIAHGKVSEGTATMAAEHGPWTGTAEKAEEAHGGLIRDGPRTLAGFFSIGCNFWC